MDSRVFTSLTAIGKLDVDWFIAGADLTQAQDTNDYLIYDTANGALYYDAVAIAVLGASSHPPAARIAGFPTSLDRFR